MFSNRVDNTTDIVQVSRSIPQVGRDGMPGGGMKRIKTFQKVINFVMQHGERLVLDDYIYLNVEKDGSSVLQLVQSLE